MQLSALDMVRANTMAPLGKARDAQARAIARARLMRDDAKIGTRAWNDANAVVEDLEQIERLLDGAAEAVTAPPVKPATAAGQQRQAAAPSPPPTAEGSPRPAVPRVSLSKVRSCAAAGCQDCKGLLAAIEGPDTPEVIGIAVGYLTGDHTPVNGVGATDRAG